MIAPAGLPTASEPVALWLILRAFASGCTAMTGVEAVSNGVSAFREPRVRNAHGTLLVIVAVLGLLLLGIGHLAFAYRIMAMDQTSPGYQSVVSQLVGAIYGRGWFHYVAIGSVLAVLCLSANTVDLSEDVTALHVAELEGPDAKDHEDRLRAEWSEFVEAPARRTGRRPPDLRIVRSEYRSVLAPLLRAIKDAGQRRAGRPVFVVLPEIVEGRWWQRLLHTHRERRLRARLLRYGGPDVAVIGVPWQLEAARPEAALAQEEPVPQAAQRA